MAGNLDSRRFFRLDLPVHCWTMPTSRIVGCDIYATPAVYWTGLRRAEVKKAQENVIAAAQMLKEDADLVMDVYKDVSQRLELFLEVFLAVEKGRNPLELPVIRQVFALLKEENQLLIFYEQSAPKTYNYIKAIYDKIALYLIEVIYLSRHSTSRKIAFSKLVNQTNTAANIYIEKLKVTEFSHLELPQFIIKLGYLVDLYLDAFGEFQQDVVDKNFPSRWVEFKANLSEGGMRVELPKTVPQGEQICIAFYNKTSPGILGVKGLVVNSRPLKDSLDYEWRINFDFPDRTQQMLIQSIMNQCEIAAAEAKLYVR